MSSGARAALASRLLVLAAPPLSETAAARDLPRPASPGATRAKLGVVAVVVLVATGLGALGYGVLSQRTAVTRKASAAASASSPPTASVTRIDRRAPLRYSGKGLITDRRIPRFDAATLAQAMRRSGFSVRQTLSATADDVMYSVTLESECGGSISYREAADAAAASRGAAEVVAASADALVAVQDNRWIVLSLYVETGPDPWCNELMLDALSPK